MIQDIEVGMDKIEADGDLSDNQKIWKAKKEESRRKKEEKKKQRVSGLPITRSELEQYSMHVTSSFIALQNYTHEVQGTLLALLRILEDKKMVLQDEINSEIKKVNEEAKNLKNNLKT